MYKKQNGGIMTRLYNKQQNKKIFELNGNSNFPSLNECISLKPVPELLLEKGVWVLPLENLEETQEPNSPIVTDGEEYVEYGYCKISYKDKKIVRKYGKNWCNDNYNDTTLLLNEMILRWDKYKNDYIELYGYETYEKFFTMPNFNVDEYDDDYDDYCDDEYNNDCYYNNTDYIFDNYEDDNYV